MHDSLGIFVDHIGDANGRNNLKKIWCDAFEQASEAFVLYGLLCNIPDASIGGWMKDCALSLKSGSKEVDRIDQSSTKSTLTRSAIGTTPKVEVSYRKSSNATSGKGTGHSIILVTAKGLGIVARKTSLQELEGTEINCRIWKHADEAHGQSTIRCLDSTLLVHLLGCLDNELVASGTSCDTFTLHSIT